MRIELVYDGDCPHVRETRVNLARALRDAGLPERWNEWEKSNAPAHMSAFGSPTVLVDGQDLAGGQLSGSGQCCRLYQSGQGSYVGAPPADLIRQALKERAAVQTPYWRQALLSVPGVVFSVLPFGGCPACWPVYAGILSALGLSFLLSSTYLLPVTALFIATAVGTLAYQARRRRGHGPCAAGLLGAGAVVAGKFILGDDRVTYAGVTVLMIAAAWNAWPRRAAAHCPKCAPSASGLSELSAPEKTS